MIKRQKPWLLYALVTTLFWGIWGDLTETSAYHVFDYVKGKDIVTIKGVNPFINVSFHKYLLIEVYSNKRKNEE